MAAEPPANSHPTIRAMLGVKPLDHLDHEPRRS